MKTPEEIKKGLRVCDSVGRVLKAEGWCKEKCPYMDSEFGCGQDYLLADALDYIKQLEEGIEQWELVAASPGAVEDMGREIARLEAEIDRQRERIRVLELSLQAVNDGNAALQRENLMLESRVPRWISVGERLPEDDEMYLVYTTEHTCAVYRYWGDGEWETEWGEDASHDISHWMPLPSAPKEDD